MILRIAMLGVVVLTALQAQQAGVKAANTKSAQKKATSQKSAPLAVGIPAGAREIEPNTYAYTDKDGKKWIYRRTPFGIVRIEDKPQPKPAEDATHDVKVTEDGDVLHFESQTPFGPAKWSRKKTELDDSERAAWERALKRQSSSAPEGQRKANKEVK